MRCAMMRLLAAVVVGAGLLSGGGCAPRGAPPAPVVDPKAVFTVRAALLNLLECPSQACTVVEDLHAGQKVAVLSPEFSGWYQVRVLDDGKEGYVLARFLVR